MNEYFSQSGKYILVITKQPTKPGCWDYSVGEVSLNSVLISTVNRNYSSFPFLFIEGHPNGHDYLVCGEDYQGQTVIELDTGKRLDFLPPEAEKGHAFCWADYEFDAASNLLVVEGCHWACPYEFRFYDFSNPMLGWPEIKADDVIYESPKKPEIHGDIIKTFEMDKDDDGADTEKIAAIKTFKAVNEGAGHKLILQEEWVSEEEQKKRKANKEATARYEAEIKLFKETDSLYLRYRELVKEMPDAETHAGVGVTYDGWCPDFKVQERRWCHRIHYKQSKGYTIDLSWGTKTGPIKLEIFKDGKTHESKFFEHSVSGMEEAFAYAKELLSLQSDLSVVK